MMFNIPFYIQKEKNDCGPTALQMVLEYLGEKHSIDELKRLVDPDKSGATWTLALANAATRLGFKSEFYTTSIGFNPENYELEFYKNETDGMDESEKKLEKLKREATKFKVKMEEKSLPLKDILSKINENCTSIVLLNWNKIKGVDKYQGHFVPIVGYDDENIYVHNQGSGNPTKNMAIPIKIFEEARKSKGTDEDIAFIYRK